MKITVEMVKELRNETGAGVMEAKKALEDAGGDFEVAATALRAKGASEAADRSDREAREGVVENYAHPGSRVGVMVELNCETDFVARNENFQSLAHNLALHVAAMQPRYLGIDDIPQDVLDRETAMIRDQALTEGKPADIVEKIISGRMSKFYEEYCLLEQPFVKDDAVKVQDLVTEAIRMMGENIIIRRFVRYELGEDL
ncbi:MAG TPA: translation elongation factor Ts [Patescibacteria group bacterium]|jgi:elongation factor Ts|nr:translation elongation factor Ts [Patescibacteria group bacterium]